MKLIIAGSRNIIDYSLLKLLMDILNLNPDKIISGGARGVDSLAEEYAKDHGIPFELYSANWDQFGKSAGYKRNELMASNGDYLLALWDKKSKGTKHMIDTAKSRGLRVQVVEIENRSVKINKLK